MALQTGSAGKFWFATQATKGTAGAGTYYGMKLSSLELAPQQVYRNVGALVGGGLLPGNTIKTGVFSAGSITVPPALDDYMGWLMYAYAGEVSSVLISTGVYKHYFPSGADDTSQKRYLTLRRSVPADSIIYEQFEDMVVAGLSWTFAPQEFANLRADFIGRTPSEPNGSAWTWTNIKDQTSVPISSKGTFELPDGGTALVEAPNGVTIEMVNVTPDPRRVSVIGSYYPYDFPVLARNITISFSALMASKTLYDALHYSGTAWSPAMPAQASFGSIDFKSQSPDVIPTRALPYEFGFYASNMQWTATPIRLVGGELVQVAITGVVAEDPNQTQDWYMTLQNATSAYTWNIT
jgi:hypothetical protein